MLILLHERVTVAMLKIKCGYGVASIKLRCMVCWWIELTCYANNVAKVLVSINYIMQPVGTAA